MLFEWDMTRKKPARVRQHFWKSAKAAENTREFADQLFEGAVSEADTADKLVTTLSENWKFERLAAVDRNILRLAIYELRFGTAPVKVSSEDSTGFLNGILDAANKALEGTKEKGASSGA